MMTLTQIQLARISKLTNYFFENNIDVKIGSSGSKFIHIAFENSHYIHTEILRLIKSVGLEITGIGKDMVTSADHVEDSGNIKENNITLTLVEKIDNIGTV